MELPLSPVTEKFSSIQTETSDVRPGSPSGLPISVFGLGVRASKPLFLTGVPSAVPRGVQVRDTTTVTFSPVTLAASLVIPRQESLLGSRRLNAGS